MDRDGYKLYRVDVTYPVYIAAKTKEKADETYEYYKEEIKEDMRLDSCLVGPPIEISNMNSIGAKHQTCSIWTDDVTEDEVDYIYSCINEETTEDLFSCSEVINQCQT